MGLFKRKAKNRKNERESVLEVKMRSRTARAARIRLITATVAAVGGTALCVLLGWQALQWTLNRFVYANEAYAIRRIELRHEGRLRPDTILRWAGVEVGRNLLALDLDRVRHDLELNPWISRAEVEARRPDCLALTAFEREPVARIVVWRVHMAERNAWPETNYVDAEGYVMPPLRPEWLRPSTGADFSHLTRLVGLEYTEVVPGQRLNTPQIRAALALIRAYENSSMYSRVDLEELHVGYPDVLPGTLRGGMRMVFGLDGHERQMRRWRSIHDHSESIGRGLASLDLSVTNNLPARWLDSTNPVVPAPRPSKPPRPAKRHV